MSIIFNIIMASSIIDIIIMIALRLKIKSAKEMFIYCSAEYQV